jgi:GH24 family phage-related lysozyme (muramidase)
MNEELYKLLYAKLESEEGNKSKVYKDSQGHLTAGIGHKLVGDELIKWGEGDEVPEAQRKAWAEKDIQTAYDASTKQAQEMNIDSESFINDLVSVNYQLGTSWGKGEGKFPKAYEALVEGRYDDAIKEINTNSKGEPSAWRNQTPDRVKNFESGIQTLNLKSIKDMEPTEEEIQIQNHKRALSYDFGITKRDTPQGFNTFLITKSFGLPFNIKKNEPENTTEEE